MLPAFSLHTHREEVEAKMTMTTKTMTLISVTPCDIAHAQNVALVEELILHTEGKNKLLHFQCRTLNHNSSSKGDSCKRGFHICCGVTLFKMGTSSHSPSVALKGVTQTHAHKAHASEQTTIFLKKNTSRPTEMSNKKQDRWRFVVYYLS